jgi:hypothetical protein
MSRRTAMRHLCVKQDIICADVEVFAMWCALALEGLTHGHSVKATIIQYQDGKGSSPRSHQKGRIQCSRLKNKLCMILANTVSAWKKDVAAIADFLMPSMSSSRLVVLAELKYPG